MLSAFEILRTHILQPLNQIHLEQKHTAMSTPLGEKIKITNGCGYLDVTPGKKKTLVVFHYETMSWQYLWGQFWKHIKDFYLFTWLLSARKTCPLTLGYDPRVAAVWDSMHLAAVSEFPLNLNFPLYLGEYSPVCALIESSYKLVVIGFMISRNGGFQREKSPTWLMPTPCFKEGVCSFSLHLFVTKRKGKNVWERAGLDSLPIFCGCFLVSYLVS